MNQTNINYQLNTKNEINIAENAFSDFLEEGMEGFRNNARNGMRHNINASVLLNYLEKCNHKPSLSTFISLVPKSNK